MIRHNVDRHGCLTITVDKEQLDTILEAWETFTDGLDDKLYQRVHALRLGVKKRMGKNHDWDLPLGEIDDAMEFVNEIAQAATDDEQREYDEGCAMQYLDNLSTQEVIEIAGLDATLALEWSASQLTESKTLGHFDKFQIARVLRDNGLDDIIKEGF